MENQEQKYGRPLVYAGMTADLIHPGHINVVNEAIKHKGKTGSFLIGLVTDSGVAKFKRLPAMPWDYRKILLESMKGVDAVVPQHSPDYQVNLERYRPDIVIHGDDWKTGQPAVRQGVIDAIAAWGGKVIDVPRYHKDTMSSTDIHQYLRRSMGTTPETRRQQLARLLGAKDIVRFIEVHNGLSARIAETESQRVPYDGGSDTVLRTEEFDGVALNSSSDAVARSLTHGSAIDLYLIDEVLDVTTKPLIINNGNGGSEHSFGRMVRRMERFGVSATILSGMPETENGIEGYFGLGKSSNKQEPIEIVARKIAAGKKSQVTGDFMIFVQVHDLQLSGGLESALERANAYIEHGVDGIMLPKLDPSSNNITNFVSRYSQFTSRVPLIASPTTNIVVRERELIDLGVKVVIYERGLIERVHASMTDVVRQLLNNKGTGEPDEACAELLCNRFS